MAIKIYLSSTGSWAKHTAIIAMFGVMGALLGSCGGSGTASTTPATPPTPITLGVLPDKADVFADLPVDIAVNGGTPPYTTGSSNTVVVPAPAVTGSATTGYKTTIIAKSVNADTSVTITIRDSLGATAPITLNVKATTLNNTVTITPIAPSGTGCGGGLCSGGDARVVVSAVLNGIKLTNRPIRFDVFQGDFRFVTPGTNVLVTSIIINTDENGEAVARIQAIVTAPTQVATLTSTDTVSGLVRRTSFNIIQTTSGTGILSSLPSGNTTFTGFKPGPGLPAQCPSGGTVDYYIYGGTPPYSVVSPLLSFVTVFPSIVTTNGGSFRATQTGCGASQLIVTDAQNRVIETSQVIGVAGPAGDAPPTPTPTTLTVSPLSHTLLCGQTGTSTTTGSGTFTATQTTPGAAASGALNVTPSMGANGTSISFTRVSPTPVTVPPSTVPSSISVNVVAGTITQTVVLTLPVNPVSGTTTCP